MSEQVKIVLRGEDGSTEHAQSFVTADKYSDIRLVERNGRVYVYQTFNVEHGKLVMLFDETHVPVCITEF